MAKKSQTETAAPLESKFTKRQLLQSKRYCERRDLLTALLKDGKEYTQTEVEALIKNFLKGKVK